MGIIPSNCSVEDNFCKERSRKISGTFPKAPFSFLWVSYRYILSFFDNSSNKNLLYYSTNFHILCGLSK